MTPLRDWARLDARWYEDPVLRAVTKQAPAAMVMWPVLVGMAKAASHVDDNPDGVIRVSLEDLARACCVTALRAATALEALSNGEFLTVETDSVGLNRIRLSTFMKWQTPRSSGAERAANKRWRGDTPTVEQSTIVHCAQNAFVSDDCNSVSNEICRENDSMRNADVTPASRSRNGRVMPDRDIDRDIDVDKKEPMSTSAKPKRDLDAEAKEVFQHWLRVWDKRSVTIFTGPRRTKVIARLREGYTVTQLQEAISGYRHSSYHRGDNDQGKPYDDLALFMRDASKVDAGIQHGIAAANRSAAGRTATQPQHRRPSVEEVLAQDEAAWAEVSA